MIDRTGHPVLVFGVVLILAFVLAVPLLSLFAGVDSRIDDVTRRRSGR